MDVTLNHDKNGIEVRFDSIPNESVRDTLKANGFRWSSKQKMWWAKNTESRLNALENIEGKPSVKTSKIKESADKNNDIFDLWNLTRTDTIGSNVDGGLTTR